MQGITAWELVRDRRCCSCSCSAALFCSLETIFWRSLSLSQLMILLVFFFCYNLCRVLWSFKRRDELSNPYDLMCFLPTWLTQFIHKEILYILSFLELTKLPFCYILDSFHPSILKPLLSPCQVLRMWQPEDYKFH